MVDADVSNSTRTEWFGKKYPDRFFNIGIAESNLVGVAAGLASSGKTSVIASFAAFITCNAYDQLRMSVAYPGLDVKVVGSHAGISIGEDGASQMGIEDVALACALPGFVVIVPADEESAQGRDRGDARAQGAGLPARRPPRRAAHLHRRLSPVRDRQGQPAARRLGPDDRGQRPDGRPGARRGRDPGRRGDQGPRARHAHRQADRSQRALEAAARETGALVVAEEHLAHGGLGSVVAMTLAEIQPVPIRFVNLGDQFGESGAPDALARKVRPDRRQGRRSRPRGQVGQEDLDQRPADSSKRPYPVPEPVSPISFMSICRSSHASFLNSGFRSR